MTRKDKRILYVFLPVSVLLFVFLPRPFWMRLSYALPPCYFHYVTGWYCPGCGCTRSVRALLQGQFWLSLRYNILPLLTLIVAVLGYAEWGTHLFGRPRRLLPRHPAVIIPAGLVVFLYFIVRNIWEFMPT